MSFLKTYLKALKRILKEKKIHQIFTWMHLKNFRKFLEDKNIFNVNTDLYKRLQFRKIQIVIS